MINELLEVVWKLGAARWEPFVLAVTVIALSVWVAGRYPRLPAPLLGVMASVGLMQILTMHEREVGVLSLELPPFAGFAWHPKDVFEVLPAGFALAFVASVNILLTSRVVEHFRGRHRPLKKIDADAELGAYGIANVAAGIFAAPLSVGIPARSLANVRCGGSTRMSNLFHAIVLAGVIGLGSGLLSHIPLAALAGVTAWMGFCLLDWSTWRRIPLMRPVDAAAFLATALGVLFVNAVAAVSLGCGVYAVEWLFRRLINSGAEIAPLQAETQK
jgi:SulP family sulfate permease